MAMTTAVRPRMGSFAPCSGRRQSRRKSPSVESITANAEVCRAFVENSIGIVTYLNPFIGHHNGDLVAREAAQTGRSVKDIVL